MRQHECTTKKELCRERGEREREYHIVHTHTYTVLLLHCVLRVTIETGKKERTRNADFLAEGEKKREKERKKRIISWVKEEAAWSKNARKKKNQSERRCGGRGREREDQS